MLRPGAQLGFRHFPGHTAPAVCGRTPHRLSQHCHTQILAPPVSVRIQFVKVTGWPPQEMLSKIQLDARSSLQVKQSGTQRHARLSVIDSRSRAKAPESLVSEGSRLAGRSSSPVDSYYCLGSVTTRCCLLVHSLVDSPAGGEESQGSGADSPEVDTPGGIVQGGTRGHEQSEGEELEPPSCLGIVQGFVCQPGFGGPPDACPLPVAAFEQAAHLAASEMTRRVVTRAEARKTTTL